MVPFRVGVVLDDSRASQGDRRGYNFDVRVAEIDDFVFVVGGGGGGGRGGGVRGFDSVTATAGGEATAELANIEEGQVGYVLSFLDFQFKVTVEVNGILL